MIKYGNAIVNLIVYKLNVSYFLWNCEKLIDTGTSVISRTLTVNELVETYYANYTILAIKEISFLLCFEWIVMLSLYIVYILQLQDNMPTCQINVHLSAGKKTLRNTCMSERSVNKGHWGENRGIFLCTLLNVSLICWFPRIPSPW